MAINFEGSTAVPISISAEEVAINHLNREPSRKQVSTFAQRQMDHAIANPKTHQDFDSYRDPVTSKIKLNEMTQFIAQIRDDGRAVARQYQVHIARTYGSFEGVQVFDGISAGSRSELTLQQFRKIAKMQAQRQGMVQIAWSMNWSDPTARSNDYIHELVMWLPVPVGFGRDGTGRSVVDWKGIEVSVREVIRPNSPAAEERKLRKMLTELRGQAKIAKASAESKFTAKVKSLLRVRASQQGFEITGNTLGWLWASVAMIATGAFFALHGL